MASPVTVILNPQDAHHFLLFFLSDKQQLAIEQRPVDSGSEYAPFKDYGTSKGVIVNPSSLAAVLHGNLATVYGITQPDGEKGKWYISKLSPIYNLVGDADGGPADTTQKAIAACSDNDGAVFVYYLHKGQTSYLLNELEIQNEVGNPFTYDDTATPPVPSSNSNLAAVYFNATKERFIIFSNTDKKHFLYWVNSSVRTASNIPETGSVIAATPLAVTSKEDSDAAGPFLNIFVYYMDSNYSLNRIGGRARDQSITWFANNVVKGAPALKADTLITAATVGVYNYVYYIPDHAHVFKPFKDPIKSDWFRQPRGEN